MTERANSREEAGRAPGDAPQLIYENESGKLWFHADSRIVHHKFKKFIFGKDFRAILMRGADLVETHGARKWLSDDRLNPAFHQDDHAWAESVWFERVRKAGWSHWALVQPQKIIGRMTMERIVGIYRDKGIAVEVFTHPEDALTWLREQP